VSSQEGEARQVHAGDAGQDVTAWDSSLREAAAQRLWPATGDASLQVIATLAARLLGAAAAEVSLVAEVRVIAAGGGTAITRTGQQTSLTDALCFLVAAGGIELAVDDAVTDVRVAHLSPVTSGLVGAYLAAPLRSDDGHVVGALCVYEPGPRTWSDSDAALLRQLATAAAAQLEVATLTHDYTASTTGTGTAADRAAALAEAVAAAGIGTFDWNPRSGALSWDEPLLELFGYPRDTSPATATLEAFTARVHRDDQSRVSAALQHAIDTLSRFEADFRIVRPDGSVRVIAARGRATSATTAGHDADPLGGGVVRVVGAVTDLTAERAGDERVRRVLETMSVGYLAMDADWRITYVNTEAERVLGAGREILVGGNIWELYPDAVGTDFETGYRHVAETGETVVFDAYYPAPLNTWFEVRAVFERTGSGEGGEVAVYFLDITTRHDLQEESQREARRGRLLAAVAAELADDLDSDTCLQAICQILVPELADFAIASRLDQDTRPWQQRMRDVAAFHADPTLRETLKQYRTVRVDALTETSPVAEALRTGRLAQARFAGRSGPGQLLQAGNAHQLLLQLAPHDTLVLPLRGRGHTHGLLTLVNGAERGPITAQDVATLREVTQQIGLGLDNAALHQVQRSYAHRLQRIADFTLALGQVQSIEELVNTVTEQGLSELGCNGGAVAMLDAEPGPGGERMLVSLLTSSYGPAAQIQYGRMPLSADLPVAATARTGRRVLLADRVACLTYSPDMQAVLAATGSAAFAALPLSIGGQVLGVVTAGWAEPQSFDPEQLSLLDTFAAQVAQTLQRLQALEAERASAAAVAGMSQALQRSLLTELPEPDHLELVARYVPAADEAQVGGDWYDAFMVRDGSTCLVIGDVTGHDRTAAVQMAQVRNVLRGVAHAIVQPPAAMLHALDWALRDLAIGALATTVLAKIEQSDDEAAQGLRTLRWSSAGHLPPLLIHPDGRVEHLERPADLMLGLGVDTDRHDHTHTLTPSSTVLFYTDGLIERRGEHLDVGLRRLRTTAARLAHLPLQDLCDQLLQQLAKASEDDVALLAIRAHREDRPRPREAGPRKLAADLNRDNPVFPPDATGD